MEDLNNHKLVDKWNNGIIHMEVTGNTLCIHFVLKSFIGICIAFHVSYVQSFAGEKYGAWKRQETRTRIQARSAVQK